jgi:hypothetical protein
MTKAHTHTKWPVNYRQYGIRPAVQYYTVLAVLYENVAIIQIQVLISYHVPCAISVPLIQGGTGWSVNYLRGELR